MERVNERNNQPHLFASDEETVQAVYNKCLDLTWPHLKNSTRKVPAYAEPQKDAPQVGDVFVFTDRRFGLSRRYGRSPAVPMVHTQLAV
jgi:hypothetical protein